MKTALKISICILLFSSVSFAQKGSWTIGISSGLKGEVYNSAYINRDVYSGEKISFPPINLHVGYNWLDNIVLESGLTFVNYKTNWMMAGHNWGMGLFHPPMYYFYSALQIPLNVKYYIPLGKSPLHLFIRTGLNFQIPIHEAEDYTPLETKIFSSGVVLRYQYDMRDLKRFGILLNSELGLSYRLNNDLCVFVLAGYYAGLKKVARIIIEANAYYIGKDKNGNEYSDTEYGDEGISFRGDYWNVGFGISYTFKKKAKTNIFKVNKT
jgi:hypothetical protein